MCTFLSRANILILTQSNRSFTTTGIRFNLWSPWPHRKFKRGSNSVQTLKTTWDPCKLVIVRNPGWAQSQSADIILVQCTKHKHIPLHHCNFVLQLIQLKVSLMCYWTSNAVTYTVSNNTPAMITINDTTYMRAVHTAPERVNSTAEMYSTLCKHSYVTQHSILR